MNKLLKSILLGATLLFSTTGLVLAQATAPRDNAKSSAPARSSSSADKAGKADKSAEKDKSDSKSGAPMDINSASEQELATLPKIGEARAKAIVANRPYKGKDDLLRKKVIPQDAYNSIKDRVIAKQGASASSGSSASSGNGADGKADAKKGSDKKATEKK